VNEHLDDFIMYVGSERGLSRHTIEAYQRDALKFIQFLENHNIVSLENIHQDHIIDFLTFLKEQNYATASISRNFITLKVLFKFLKREGILSHNPALYLDTPKLWQLIPEVLNLEEVEKLLKQPDPSTAYGARDSAILELLYASGLRVSELCQIKICDVDDTCIKVFGKGGKERLIPLGKPALAAIDNYLNLHRDCVEGEKQQCLFVTRGGKAIHRISVWKMIKEYGKKAGITKNISPHTLRHSFATHLLDNGAELRVIQEMLGHASINSTDRYTHISKTHIQDAFYTFHPRK